MRRPLRVGYSMWGFLGDLKCDASGKRLENGSPDGCASYVWAALHGLQAAGHIVYMMQKDRDAGGYTQHGDRLFASYATTKRRDAYLRARQTAGEDLPELDILLLEWRFHVPGKTSLDVRRQEQLLTHYSGKDTRIIVWDLDHKLTEDDERMLPSSASIVEQSDTPTLLTRGRSTLFTPVDIDEVRAQQYHRLEKQHRFTYVGNNYERENAVDKYLVPFAGQPHNSVHIWGKWENFKPAWQFHYHPRIDMRHFGRAFAPAVCSPLLAKDSYFENGVVTARVAECLTWGTIPVGFAEHHGIARWTPFIATDAGDLAEIAHELEAQHSANDDEYNKHRERCIEMLSRTNHPQWVRDLVRIAGL